MLCVTTGLPRSLCSARVPVVPARNAQPSAAGHRLPAAGASGGRARDAAAAGQFRSLNGPPHVAHERRSPVLARVAVPAAMADKKTLPGNGKINWEDIQLVSGAHPLPTRPLPAGSLHHPPPFNLCLPSHV